MCDAPALLPLPSSTFRIHNSATWLLPIDPDSYGSQDDLPRRALEALLRTSRVLWPHLRDGDILAVESMSGAMSNKVYACHWLTAGGVPIPRGSQSLLLRLFGDLGSVFFCRAEEAETFSKMAARGVGPQLLAEFPEGRLEEYIDGQTLTAEDLRDPKISKKIAGKMRQFHGIEVGGQKRPQVWTRLRRWLNEAIKVSSLGHAKSFRLREIKAEVDVLESLLSNGICAKLAFCHNDLQYGNIMWEGRNEAIHFIDFEYAGFNPREFDISNFFCEMAADYHSDEPHLLDYSKYPDYEERFRFVNTYLRSGENESSVTKEEVERLVESTENFVLLSHLHWGLWGIISAVRDDINFDYLSYARQRFDRYEKNKWKVLGQAKKTPVEAR